MTPAVRTRLYCGATGAVIGFATGYVFLLFAPSARPFALFLPTTFAVVFAILSFFVAERMFVVLLYVISVVLALGGADFIFDHFKK